MALFHFLKNNFWLILILLFGLFIFTYHLNSIPSGVYTDEAVVGYDAFSILTTLRDHYGQTLPLYFKFFNSYTPGLFVYLTTLFIKIFGLTPFALRLPSALSMLIIAAAIYYFCRKNQLFQLKFSPLLATTFFLITPWTVFNARIGYETTFAFMLLSLGILFYHRPLPAFFLISLSTYAGHTPRYLAPLIIILIYFNFYFRKASFKKLLLPLSLCLFIQIPNLILMFTPAFWTKNFTPSLSLFIEHYLSYFSPHNLFNGQDYDLQRSLPQLAIFYTWMFFPWLAGLYTLYTHRGQHIYRYLIALILITPLPAALADTNYSTQRALPLLLPYSIVIAVGCDRLLDRLRPSLQICVAGLITLLSLILLWRAYFILFPVQRATAWNYGFDQLAGYIHQNPNQSFVIDNSRQLASILLPFWLKTPPVQYQAANPLLNPYYSASPTSYDARFGNIEVRAINWKLDPLRPQIIVGDSLAISNQQVTEHHLTKIHEIINHRGQVIFQIYQTQIP